MFLVCSILFSARARKLWNARTPRPGSRSIITPANPRASPLYRCVCEHADELREAGHIHRRIEDETPDRFLDCGDLHKGFARVHCDACGHQYLLPILRSEENADLR